MTKMPRQALPPSHAPVIPRFLKQVVSGGSVVMFGKGMQTRDFVYISDVVSALAAAATADRVSRAIINIGSGQEVSITQLIGKIERAVGREAHRLLNDAEDGGVPRLVADIRLAGELLKWKPQVSLEEGLKLILAEDERFRK